MALFSVWDWDHNSWAIYRNDRPVSVGDDPKPPRPTTMSRLGADPDTQMNPLPSDARFIGYSHVARGEVRRKPSGTMDALGLDMPSTDDVKKYAIGAVGALLAYDLWQRAFGRSR